MNTIRTFRCCFLVAAFRRRLSIYAREMELGNAWPFFVFVQDGKTLAGAVTLSNVRRGVAETGTLGYWIGQPFSGQGVATAGVRAVVGYAFDKLKLHRLERYRHRLSIEGHMLYYYAVVGRKRRDIDDACLRGL